ncbi:extracellular solute-binding protein [Jeongeupia naejangsanensis]|uniref:ABC transporter substrate-binding protein n=1 Tax=Jeongeupia naejangsanensis TaxID=613195 RepID=A0ABS2BID9_9NEIS|nr:extracellular solute-binding protein [Jeongeupia naejangsanensis]MBM3115378.1 ABC transporter substrate-binding protein [Jeongeupia naejangsanensis]
MRLAAALLMLLVLPFARADYAVALGYAPKYQTGFTHFDYVNPKAPTGGELRLAAMGDFDKLNPFTLKGRSVAGLGGLGDGLVFESLTMQSQDEPLSAYGLLADDIRIAPDGLSVTFHLNPKARFSNGRKVGADDVRFSFETLTSKRASPMFRQYWGDVAGVDVLDAETVRFRFKQRNRELPLTIGQLPVFAKEWGGGKPFDEWVQQTPIGSGPYAIESVDLGKRVVYKRRADYWGWKLPVRLGTFNFDRISYRYYQDDTARLEAFKAGEFDFTFENVARQWVRGYTGPAFRDGRIVKQTFAHENSAGMQGYAINARRPSYTDVRVRRALVLAMDFEWMNRQLFYDQYTRSPSYFSNSEIEAKGKPGPGELHYLEPLRGRIDPSVFVTATMPPTTTPPDSLRKNLLRARQLLEDAGWTYRDGALRNKKGEPFVIDMLLYQKAFERLVAPYARNLQKLGITLNYRVLDLALAQKRLDAFDYDMTVVTFGASQSPGNELYGNFGSRSANEPGSNNAMGISDPAVDALIDAVVQAPDRAALVDAGRALDRVLRAGYYLVPNWHNRVHRVAFRAGYAWPATLPKYYGAEEWAIQTWWATAGRR